MTSSSSRNVYVAAAGHSFVSQSGLVAVLKAVRKHGLPDAISRPTLKRRRAEAIPQATPVGPLWGSIQLLCEGNSLLELPVCNPYALLYVTLENCQPFREYFESVVESVGNSARAPFRIICYCDEILPGDQLKATNMRKLIAFYWSILDFRGQLGREELWFQLACCRTTRVKKVQVLLGDEAALKQCWSNKGSSGLFICLFCQNVTNHLLDLAGHDSTGRLVPSYVCSLQTCAQHTDQSINQAAKKLVLEKGRLGKGAFEELEKALGLTFSAEGALYDENFMNSIPGAASMTSFDWMHVYLVSGLWNSEVSLLLDALNKEHGMGALALANFLKTVTWPKKVSSKGTTGIKALEKHKDGHLSCSAAEGLSLYAPVRCFLQTKVPQSTVGSAASKAVRSYFCLAAVLDLLVKTRKGAVAPELQQCIEAHMTAGLDAYKAKNMQPKSHYSLHLPVILARDGVLASCWAHERKHRCLKRHGNNSTNANKKLSWEKGVIEEVVLSQYLELQEWDPRGGIELIDAKDASVDMTDGLKQSLGLTMDASVRMFVGQEVQCNYESMSRGDAVCTSTHMVEIWFHVQVVSDIHGTSFHSIVSKWKPLQGDRPVPGAADLMHARHLQDCEAISWADLCGRELTAGSPSETPSCQLQGPQGAAVQLRAAQDIVTLQTLGELRITGHFQMTSLRLEAQTLNFEDAEVEAWHEVSSAPNLTTKGGAFYSSGSFTVTRSNLTVRGTGAAYGGGFFAGGDLSICQNAKVVVENVSAKLDGGGFFVLGDADISDDSLVFIRHARSGELGGGFKTKRRLQVTNRSTVNIVNATSGKQGGGFQVNGRLQVTDSSSVSLQNVTAGQHGGGFFALGEVEIAGSSTVNIRNSHAESGDGGGFDIESSMKVSTGSTLRMHNATAGRWGGGFYARKVVISGSAVSIQHASAEEQGGGFYAKEIVVEMMSTVNIVNATSGEQGGGFQVEGRLHVIGSSCVSLQNVTAGTYGGGFLAIGEVEIAGSSTINITNSTAGFSGGGFAVKGPIVSNRSTLRILNAKAGSYGGGFDATKVLISGSSVSLQNVTAGTHGGGFRALGEVEIAGSSTVNIRNSHAESGSGGGFDIEGLKVLTGSTLRIWNARAEWYGGGFSARTVVIRGSTVSIQHAAAEALGGGFVSEKVVVAAMSTVNIFRASAGQGGGCQVEGRFQVTNSSAVSVQHAAAREHGGGFYAKEIVVEMMSTVNIVNATSGERGGGFQVDGRLQVTNSSSVSLQNVTAGTLGGGFSVYGNVEIAGSSTINIESGGGGFKASTALSISRGSMLRIWNATAGGSGGGFIAQQVAMSSSKLGVQHVTAGQYGGGFVTLAEVVLAGHSILNIVHAASGEQGGGFQVQGRLHVTNSSTVSVQHAKTRKNGGGFLAAEVAIVGMSTVNIVNATSGERGGGFRVDGRLQVTNSSCISLQNVTAGQQGGGFLAHGEVEIAGSSTINITNSTARSGRGGGFLAGKGLTISNSSVLRIRNATAGKYGGRFQANKVLISSSRVSVQETRAGETGGGFYVLVSVALANGSTLAMSNTHAVVDSGGFFAAGLIAQTSLISISNATASGSGTGCRVDEVLLSAQSNLEIRGAHGIENSTDSSVLTANCLHIRDKPSIRFEGVTGGHVVDLQNSGCSSQCSNDKTFEVASDAAFNATGHLSGGLLSVAACENETVRLSGIDLKSWSSSLLSTRPSQVVVDGVSVEYVPPVNNLQVLAAKDWVKADCVEPLNMQRDKNDSLQDGFTIDSLTASCPACGHGVTFNASHDGRLQALSPETLQRATVSKGLTPLCNCTNYQILG
eukprot:s3514_g6.t2